MIKIEHSSQKVQKEGEREKKLFFQNLTSKKFSSFASKEFFCVLIKSFEPEIFISQNTTLRRCPGWAGVVV